MSELARTIGESAFIEMLNRAEQLVKFWTRGELPAIGLEDRLIEMGFFNVTFTGLEGQVKAQYLNAVIPLGRWS